MNFPNEALKRGEKLGIKSRLVYLAIYSDGCQFFVYANGQHGWQGRHAPHNQFIKDNPIREFGNKP